MSRRKEIKPRKILPDIKYDSVLIEKFINCTMRQGKKSIVRKIVYGALDIIQEKANPSSVLEFFEKAVDNVRPVLEVKSRRVGGSTYQVPTEVRDARRTALAIRWLLTNAKKRGEKSMEAKLAFELMDAANNRGASVKKKEDTHKMAEANKAFAHYRW